MINSHFYLDILLYHAGWGVCIGVADGKNPILITTQLSTLNISFDFDLGSLQVLHQRIFNDSEPLPLHQRNRRGSSPPTPSTLLM